MCIILNGKRLHVLRFHREGKYEKYQAEKSDFTVF